MRYSQSIGLVGGSVADDDEQLRPGNDNGCRQSSDGPIREAIVAWDSHEFCLQGRDRSEPAVYPTIETEFLANIVLPDDTTAGEWMLPQIDRAYRTGEMPPLLPAAGNSYP